MDEDRPRRLGGGGRPRPSLPGEFGAAGGASGSVCCDRINGTPDYWQWASVDVYTGEPMPKEEALARMRDLIDLASITSKSRIKSKLLTP